MVKEIKYMFLYVSFCLKSISPRESGEHEHTHMAKLPHRITTTHWFSLKG